MLRFYSGPDANRQLTQANLSWSSPVAQLGSKLLSNSPWTCLSMTCGEGMEKVTVTKIFWHDANEPQFLFDKNPVPARWQNGTGRTLLSQLSWFSPVGSSVGETLCRPGVEGTFQTGCTIHCSGNNFQRSWTKELQHRPRALSYISRRAGRPATLLGIPQRQQLPWTWVTFLSSLMTDFF